MKPTQILRKMSQLSSDEPLRGEFWKGFFLKPLPSNIQPILASMFESSTREQLVDTADLILEATKSAHISQIGPSLQRQSNALLPADACQEPVSLEIRLATIEAAIDASTINGSRGGRYNTPFRQNIVMEWSNSTSADEMRSFLGLSGYYSVQSDRI
ncbi:unnamed protein product [Mesocestoides corti]|uniref:Rab3 GTPase-activating protein catalytic subunit n=1 Tax=Mesocestoides corti TaxID=53468 RepID=A0A0R3U8I5_MESCO|nr:unnamed protein product [Mesocestoides corti]